MATCLSLCFSTSAWHLTLSTTAFFYQFWKYGLPFAALRWIGCAHIYRVAPSLLSTVAIKLMTIPSIGPLAFTAYTEDSTDIIQQHGVHSESFADDTQLFESASLADVSDVRWYLSADVMSWCAARRFQLNADKTEEMLVGSRNNLTKLASQDHALTTGMKTIKPTTVVRNLGVWVDNDLSLKQHVAKVASVCFYQPRCLRQIHQCPGREVTTRLVLALVISRLDYCNSLLSGLPNCTLDVLQRVQNASARVICQLKPCDHVSSSLRDMH